MPHIDFALWGILIFQCRAHRFLIIMSNFPNALGYDKGVPYLSQIHAIEHFIS